MPMTEQTMFERVAKALASTPWAVGDAKYYLEDAKVAVEAMREPINEMAAPIPTKDSAMDTKDINPADVVAGIVRLNNELEVLRKQNRRLIFDNQNLKEDLEKASKALTEITDLALKHMQAAYDEAISTGKRLHDEAESARTKILDIQRKLEEERPARNPT